MKSKTVCFGAVFALCIPCTAQLKPPTPANYQPELTAWGTPKIEGVWDFRTLTPLERPAELADKPVLTIEEAKILQDQTINALDVDQRTTASEVDVEGAYNTFWYDWGSGLNEDRRTSLIFEPSDGRLPALTAEAREQLAKQNRTRTPPVRDLFSFGTKLSEFRPSGPESLGLSERCLLGLNAGPPITPSTYNNNLRIIQTPTHIMLVTEMIHDTRIVPMDNRPHLPAELTLWSGDSRGRWEGETLVIETTNFTDKTPSFQIPVNVLEFEKNGGIGSGADMRLVERFTPMNNSRLIYEYTLENAKAFVQPFSARITMRASSEPMFEYACHEGNYALPAMLRGARFLESETLESTQASQ